MKKNVQKQMDRIRRRLDAVPVFFAIFLLVILSIHSCQQEDIIHKAKAYSNNIYDLKAYKVERHPPVVRNGFGMDIYHKGNSGLDTMYLSETLPSCHPNNCNESGTVCCIESVAFEYDLLFYNEFAYSQNYAGDYNGTGFPVIFMYVDPENAENSTKAAMVGQGIDCFNLFTVDSISNYEDDLTSDPQICLADYRTELHTETVEGTITLRDDISTLYATLTIGNKFRPNIGGVIESIDSDDEKQLYQQPVFLIRTREGVFAKFMVTRFKGVGEDTQKLTLQWQALKTQ